MYESGNKCGVPALLSYPHPIKTHTGEFLQKTDTTYRSSVEFAKVIGWLEECSVTAHAQVNHSSKSMLYYNL